MTLKREEGKRKKISGKSVWGALKNSFGDRG